MDKLAAKTAAYTLLFVCALLVAAFSFLTLFSPMTLSDLAFRSGGEKLSVRYAELACRGEAKTKNLGKLVERSSLAGRYDNVVRYGTQLLSRGDFATYAAFRDENPVGETEVAGKYADYMAGLVACAYYRTGDGDAALAFAAETEEGKYPQYGAKAGLVYLAVGEGDAEFGKAVYDMLTADPPKEDSGAYAGDLAILKGYLGIED